MYRSLISSFVAFALIGCSKQPEEVPKLDPVQEFRAMFCVEAPKGIEIPPHGDDTWTEAFAFGAITEIDVQKTESQVSPLLGTVTFPFVTLTSFPPDKSRPEGSRGGFKLLKRWNMQLNYDHKEEYVEGKWVPRWIMATATCQSTGSTRIEDDGTKRDAKYPERGKVYDAIWLYGIERIRQIDSAFRMPTTKRAVKNTWGTCTLEICSHHVAAGSGSSWLNA